MDDFLTANDLADRDMAIPFEESCDCCEGRCRCGDCGDCSAEQPKIAQLTA